MADLEVLEEVCISLENSSKIYYLYVLPEEAVKMRKGMSLSYL
jgi:hypothetical protein